MKIIIMNNDELYTLSLLDYCIDNDTFDYLHISYPENYEYIYTVKRDGMSLFELLYIKSSKIIYDYSGKSLIRVKSCLDLIDKYRWTEKTNYLINEINFTKFDIDDLTEHEKEIYNMLKSKEFIEESGNKLIFVCEKGNNYDLIEYINNELIFDHDSNSDNDFIENILSIDDIINYEYIYKYYDNLEEDCPELTQSLIDKGFNFTYYIYNFRNVENIIITKDFLESFIFIYNHRQTCNQNKIDIYNYELNTCLFLKKNCKIFEYIIENSNLIEQYLMIDHNLHHDKDMINIIFNKLLNIPDIDLKLLMRKSILYINDNVIDLISKIIDMHPDAINHINILFVIDYCDVKTNDYIYNLIGFDKFKHLFDNIGYGNMYYLFPYNKDDLIDYYFNNIEFIENFEDHIVEYYVLYPYDKYLDKLKEFIARTGYDVQKNPDILHYVNIKSPKTIKYLLEYGISSYIDAKFIESLWRWGDGSEIIDMFKYLKQMYDIDILKITPVKDIFEFKEKLDIKVLKYFIEEYDINDVISILEQCKSILDSSIYKYLIEESGLEITDKLLSIIDFETFLYLFEKGIELPKDLFNLIIPYTLKILHQQNDS